MNENGPGNVRAQRPDGWESKRLEEVLDVKYGKALPAKTRVAGDVAVCTSAGVTGSHNVALANGPALVIGRKGAAGRVTLVTGPFWATDTAFYALVPEEHNSEFLAALVSNIGLRQLDQSTAVPSLSRDRLRAAEILIPARHVQDSIVAAIDEEFARIDAIEAELVATDRLREQFRTALLRDAFTGRLVSVSGASRAGAVNGNGRTELPEGWGIKTMGDCADCRLGKMLDKAKNRGRPRPYIGNINVQWQSIETTDLKTMRIEDSETERYGLRKGDILMCEGGEPGRCAVWDSDEEVFFQKAVHRIRPNVELSADFLVWQMRFAAHTHSLEPYFTGTTIKHLSAKNLVKVPVVVPPLQEQNRIVSIIGSEFARIDAIETVVKEARCDLDRMRRSILHQAFIGQLLPHEAGAGVMA